MSQASNLRACGIKPQRDYEIQTACMCDDVSAAGNRTEMVCYVTAAVLYLGPGGVNGQQLLGTFTDDTLCTPYVPVNPVPCDDPGRITQFDATAIDLQGLGWDSISILTPFCCNDDLVAVTNLGEFRIPPGVCAFSPDAFERGLITELTIIPGPLGSQCDLRDVQINAQYHGRTKAEYCGQ